MAIIAAALAFFILSRTGWNLLRPTIGTVGEAANVAAALAQGRGYADSYQPGQGPTAHVLPINPIIAGAVYTVFGIRSWAAETTLAAWSIMVSAAQYPILSQAFKRLGTPETARVGAIAFLCFLPAFISQEAVDFRVWEGGLAALLMATLLLLVIDRSRWPVLTLRHCLWPSIVAALLFFVNPLIGLGGYACLGVLYLRQLDFRRMMMAGIIAALALSAILVPWVLRNHATFGTFVLLRSNAGLELALATNPAMIDTPDKRDAYYQRLNIHPAAAESAYREMQASGGEVAYSKKLGRETTAWIVANPQVEMQIMLRHLRDLYLPGKWMFELFGNHSLSAGRAACATIVNLVGLAAIVWAVWRRRPGWIYPALLILCFTLPLTIFQPIPRYIYIIYALFAFSAASGIHALFARLARQSRTALHVNSAVRAGQPERGAGAA